MIAKITPKTQLIGQNIFYFNQIESTNTFAHQFAKEQTESNGVVFFAEEQTKGRGQNDKHWKSEPNKNLSFSFIFESKNAAIEKAFYFNKLICLSVLQALKSYLQDEKVEIKWPNDIFVNKKKIAGILIENNIQSNKIKHSIVGIGINVNQSFVSEKSFVATSVYDVLSTETSREDLFCLILETIDKNLFLSNETLIEKTFDENLLGFNTFCEFLDASSIKFTAKVVGVNNHGQLLVESNGLITAYLHGSIKQII